MEVVNALGRRKSAVARVFVSEGTGKITINKRDLAQYFPSTILKNMISKLTCAVVVSLVSLRLCVWLSLVHWLKSIRKIRKLFVLKVS